MRGYVLHGFLLFRYILLHPHREVDVIPAVLVNLKATK